ncbi:DUF6953 family protein [Dietzia natronolimnaea]|uniref:DUF6953 family protein n=1 Tax=Dietzia natronolimnaea TaxID=161920 RepID=UPI0015FD8B29|nr:hypothetical protein [Dietzia natronolimnaea]MBB1037365.1 hypothetical protein [Dietzia natronolimnaea]
MAKATEIALWMIDQFKDRQTISQHTMAMGIRKNFGPEWLYRNQNGNPAIDRKVLAEFRKLRDDSIEWDRSTQDWRVKRPKQP